MESQAKHLPASAMPQVEFRVELVIGDLQATPCKGTIHGKTAGAESTWSSQSAHEWRPLDPPWVAQRSDPPAPR